MYLNRPQICIRIFTDVTDEEILKGEAVKITDEKGEPLEDKCGVPNGGPHKIRPEHRVKFEDRATWYWANPTCIWHDGREH